jgi:hypothetical protein
LGQFFKLLKNKKNKFSYQDMGLRQEAVDVTPGGA